MTKRVSIALAVLAAAFQVNAQAPNLLNYQGNLTNPGGTPQNGTFTIVFKVYDAVAGGHQLPTSMPWSETQDVTITNGVFNVLLGSVTAMPTDLFQGGPSDALGPLRFLDVTVNGETLTPRRRIASAAYALGNGGLSAGSGARAYLTSNQQFDPALLPAKIVFDAESYDRADEYSTVTGRFTAVADGFYFVNVGVPVEDDACGNPGGPKTIASVSIRKNGVVYSELGLTVDAYPAPQNEDNPRLRISEAVEMQAGDYLEVWFEASACPFPVTVFSGSVRCVFSIGRLP